MCISGDIPDLTRAQWQLVESAMRLYRQAVPIIKQGNSRIFGSLEESWRHPRGWQAVRRVGERGQQALVVIHSFEQAPQEIRVPLPAGYWQITDCFPSNLEITEGAILWRNPADFSATVLLVSAVEGRL